MREKGNGSAREGKWGMGNGQRGMCGFRLSLSLSPFQSCPFPFALSPVSLFPFSCPILLTSRMIRRIRLVNCGDYKMSDRKYNQRGYMQSDGDSQRSKPQSKPKGKPPDREGPRSPRMMAFSEASKCTACGAQTPTIINFDRACPKCNANLHSCRQCTHFDPGARFECNKPIPARIVDKHAGNTCELFAARIVVERQTSSGPPTNARDAFAKLFKK